MNDFWTGFEKKAKDSPQARLSRIEDKAWGKAEKFVKINPLSGEVTLAGGEKMWHQAARARHAEMARTSNPSLLSHGVPLIPLAGSIALHRLAKKKELTEDQRRAATLGAAVTDTATLAFAHDSLFPHIAKIDRPLKSGEAKTFSDKMMGRAVDIRKSPLPHNLGVYIGKSPSVPKGVGEHVMLGRDTGLGVLAHELGHAKQDKAFGGPMMENLTGSTQNSIVLAAPFLAVNSGPIGAAAPYIALAGGLPSLIEEGGASLRGLSAILKQKGIGSAARAAVPLTSALLTHLTPSLASAYLSHRVHSVFKKKKMEENK